MLGYVPPLAPPSTPSSSLVPDAPRDAVDERGPERARGVSLLLVTGLFLFPQVKREPLRWVDPKDPTLQPSRERSGSWSARTG